MRAGRAVAALLALCAGAAVCARGPGSWARGEELLSVEVGKKAPPLALAKLLQAPEGASADWNALKGKAVVLEFWSTGCGPCLSAIPHMNDLAGELKGRPVQFIAVTRDPAERIERFIGKRRMAAWVGIDDDGATFKAYGVRGIPRTVLIDDAGAIVATTHPSILEAEDIEKVIAGDIPDFEPPEGKKCDVRKAACGQRGGDEAVVVTLEESEDGGKRGGCSYGPGRIEVRNMEPERFLPHVYHIVYGIPVERVKIEAEFPKDARYMLKARADSRDNAALKDPLKTAVEKEFSLSSRIETRETDVYVLAVDPAKRALLAAADESDDRGVAHVDERQVILINRPIADLAIRLERRLKLPVMDETGLEGKYDLAAEWKGEGVEEMTKAMRESLGLVLAPARRPVEMCVVTGAGGKGVE